MSKIKKIYSVFSKVLTVVEILLLLLVASGLIYNSYMKKSITGDWKVSEFNKTNFRTKEEYFDASMYSCRFKKDSNVKITKNYIQNETIFPFGKDHKAEYSMILGFMELKLGNKTEYLKAEILDKNNILLYRNNFSIKLTKKTDDEKK